MAYHIVVLRKLRKHAVITPWCSFMWELAHFVSRKGTYFFEFYLRRMFDCTAPHSNMSCVVPTPHLLTPQPCAACRYPLPVKMQVLLPICTAAASATSLRTHRARPRAFVFLARRLRAATSVQRAWRHRRRLLAALYVQRVWRYRASEQLGSQWRYRTYEQHDATMLAYHGGYIPYDIDSTPAEYYFDE